MAGSAGLLVGKNSTWYDGVTISRGWLYEQKEKDEMEYRFYEVPEKCPVLALLGEKWVQNYGYQIDYLHFHNMMEIGVCYYGEGTIVLEDKEIPYDGGAFTVVPKNFPHTTNSKENSLCSWAWLFIDVEGFITKLYKDNSRMAQKLISRINQRLITRKMRTDLRWRS